VDSSDSGLKKLLPPLFQLLRRHSSTFDDFRVQYMWGQNRGDAEAKFLRMSKTHIDFSRKPGLAKPRGGFLEK
jgi:hypothetical protein